MRSLIHAYRKFDPAAKSDLEVLLLYPGIKALGLHRIAHGLYLQKLFFPARAVAELGRWLTGIEIHPGATIGANLVLDHGMGTVIGETAIIGDNVIIYQGVTLGGTSLSSVKRHPTIEDRVLIGAGAKVLGNVTVGSDTRIGANSVVVDHVPASSVVVGIPGKAIPKVFMEPFYYDFHI